MDEEEMSYGALAALEPEARMHPTLGVLVSPNGRVLLPGRKGACGALDVWPHQYAWI